MRHYVRLLSTALVFSLSACKDSSGPACTISGVTMNPPSAQLRVGESINIPAAVAAANCGVTLPSLEYSSSQPSVASVSATGTITALAVGTTTITARLAGRMDQASATVTVSGRVLTIAIRPTAPSVPVTGTLTLATDVTTDPGTPTTVRWVSSDPSRATVNTAGVVTGVAAGTTTITAIADADTTRRATATLTVVPRVTGLQVVPGATSLRVAETRQLAATVAGDSGVVTAVTWRSANPALATVNASGLVTAVGAGQVLVTATSTADTTRNASATITVIPRVNAVAVEPAARTILVAGTAQLAAAVTGDPGVSTAVTWRSADPAVATVSGTGLVTGVAAGQVIVTATSVQDTTRRGSATITVQPRVSGVTIGLSGAQSIPVGATLPLTATVGGDPGVSQAVTWSSSNAAMATVSALGVVTGVSPGTVTITVRSVADPTRTATISVTVFARVTAVSVTPNPATVDVGGTVQLQATVAGDPGVSQGVNWTSSDATRATVNANGVITGVAAGSVVITARSAADPTRSGTATVAVTVASPAALDCILVYDPNQTLGAPGAVAPSGSSCSTGISEVGFAQQLSVGIKTVTGQLVAATFSSSNPSRASVQATSSTTGLLTSHSGGEVTLTGTTAQGSLTWTFFVDDGYGDPGSQRVIPLKRPSRTAPVRPARQ